MAYYDEFYAQRARRIYPPYLIAITGCLAIVMTTGFASRDLGVSALQSWAASLFYLHGLLFDVPSRVDPPIWSLEVEIQFYLLSPFIIWAYTLRRHGNTRVVVGFMAVSALILTASLVDFIYPFDGRFRFGLLAPLVPVRSGNRSCRPCPLAKRIAGTRLDRLRRVACHWIIIAYMHRALSYAC